MAYREQGWPSRTGRLHLRARPGLISLNTAGGPLLDVFGVGRWLYLSAVIAAAGISGFRFLLSRLRTRAELNSAFDERLDRRTRNYAIGIGVVLITGLAVRGYSQAMSFLLPDDPRSWALIGPIFMDTTWGTGWLLQLGASLLFLAGLSFIRTKAAGWNVVHAGVLALLLATPVTGHAVAGTWGWKVEIPLHALHLAGSGLWLGTLLCIIGVGYPVARLFGEPEAGRLIGNMVHRFNPLALTGAAVVVAGGGLLSFAYVGLIEQNWGTAYGVTLLVKIGLLLVVLVLGAYNWRRLRPRLGLPAGSESLRRTATVELIIGSLVLLATAILVHLPAPRV